MATATYYFNSYSLLEAWETNPGNMVDADENTSAATTVDVDVELCTGNTCPGTYLGTITKVEIRTKGFYNPFGVKAAINLRPVFEAGDGDSHMFLCGVTAAWSQWFDITTDTNAPSPWDWDDVEGLDCDVVGGKMLPGVFTLWCYMVQIRITYTVRVPKPTAAVGNPLIFQVLSIFSILSKHLYTLKSVRVVGK